MGLYTLNGGLELAGSPLAASHLIPTTSTSSTAASAQASGSRPSVDVPAGATVANGHQTITITATSDGYTPTVAATPGIPTTLVIHSEDAQGCIRAFTIPDRNVQKILPASGDTRVELGALSPGTLDYVCGMGMYTGQITTN